MDPTQDISPGSSCGSICLDSLVLLVQSPRPAAIALQLLNQAIGGRFMVSEPRLQMSVPNHDPNMPGGDHAGGELIAIKTDSTSALRQGKELIEGIGERFRTCRLVFGRVNAVFVEPDVVASSNNSTSGLILMVSGNDEAEGGEDEANLDGGKAEADGNRVHGFLVM